VPLPERKLIETIRRRAQRGRPRRDGALVRGIGDDCAVLRPAPGHDLLVTTDFSLEGVHFRRDWHLPESVGHRCLARGLSDIAAMGGVPLAAFLSLAVPASLPQEWIDEFLAGFLRLARLHHTPLGGGDTAGSPSGILADMVVLGSVPRGKAVLRSGARAGDDIYVTGALGAPAAVLRRLQPGDLAESKDAGALRRRAPVAPPAQRDGMRKFLYPQPRLAVGQWLRARGLASAMIDISDGLSTDLSHICEESRTGAWLAEAALPIARGSTLEDALHGGDEYELLFTARPARYRQVPEKLAGVPVRWIGTVTQPPGLWLVAPDMKSRRPLEPRGWEHLS
jgi:thiamine-monophosphate kinase